MRPSLSALIPGLRPTALPAFGWLPCVGMAGFGLQTGFAALKVAGLRPIAAGAA